MGQRLSGQSAGRPKERSRILALLSLAALAAFFRLLLQAGKPSQPELDGPAAAGAGAGAGVHDSMAAAEQAQVTEVRRGRPSLRHIQPPVAPRSGSPAAPVNARRYGGTLGPDAGRASVNEELADLAGAVAWSDDVDPQLSELSDFPETIETPVALVEREPALPAVEPLAPLMDESAIKTLAEIEALPEVVEPRSRPIQIAPERSRPETPVRPTLLSRDRTWRVAMFAIAAIALALRLIGHSSNYDLFIDEITYSQIGQAVALGHGVVLYGTPFFLHPPLFFYLEAGVMDLFGAAHGAPVQLVMAMRPINCVIGAIECLLMMQLIARFSGRRAAIAVGMFLAVDPFLLLWDGRVLLETPAMTLAVAGWLCLDWIARVQAAAAGGDARGTRGLWAMCVLGGLLFGASLLSKETYVFVGVVPLFIMLVLGSPVKRRITAAMLAVATGCYGVYLITVETAGHLSLWWNQNSAGLARAAGTKQITGFNQAGHHASLSSSISQDLSLYLISYLVIMAVFIAALTGVIRWFRAVRAGRALTVARRMAIALGAGCVGYVGYAVLLGAFEVQIFYMCIVGGLPVLVSELQAASWSRLKRTFSARTLLIATAALASLALIFELSVDVRLRSEKDTSLSQLVSYVSHNVPNGAMVDSTDQVTQFVLQGVRIDGPTTVKGLKHEKPGYVVVDQGLVNKGYDNLGAGFQTWLNRHAQLVFRTDGLSTGTLELYKTTYANATPGS